VISPSRINLLKPTASYLTNSSIFLVSTYLAIYLLG
jgi:hypothetical protein